MPDHKGDCPFCGELQSVEIVPIDAFKITEHDEGTIARCKDCGKHFSIIWNDPIDGEYTTWEPIPW